MHESEKGKKDSSDCGGCDRWSGKGREQGERREGTQLEIAVIIQMRDEAQKPGVARAGATVAGGGSIRGGKGREGLGCVRHFEGTQELGMSHPWWKVTEGLS